MLSNVSLVDVLRGIVDPWKGIWRKTNLSPVQEYEAKVSLQLYKTARERETLKDLAWSPYREFRYGTVWTSWAICELTSAKTSENKLTQPVAEPKVTAPTTADPAPSQRKTIKIVLVMNKTSTPRSASSGLNTPRAPTNRTSVAKKRPFEEAGHAKAANDGNSTLTY